MINRCVLFCTRVNGDSMVYGEASVFGNTFCTDNVKIYGIAEVRDNVKYSQNVEIYDNARVYANAML
ncbi:MAG: hypothetical protein HUJ61_00025 [Bacilli bacterium]|nr:hypothetical protein [Bacilli bacterium]